MNLSAFFERISPEPNTGCWLWLGATNSKGYGCLQHNGRKSMAHRVAYETFKKTIPPGLQLDHLCRLPGCVNPWHLEPVTSRENTLRGVGPSALNTKKTRCPYGHPYSGLDHRGHRACVRCKREKGNLSAKRVHSPLARETGQVCGSAATSGVRKFAESDSGVTCRFCLKRAAKGRALIEKARAR